MRIQVGVIDKGLCPRQYLLVGLSSVTIDDEMRVCRDFEQVSVVGNEDRRLGGSPTDADVGMLISRIAF